MGDFDRRAGGDGRASIRFLVTRMKLQASELKARRRGKKRESAALHLHAGIAGRLELAHQPLGCELTQRLPARDHDSTAQEDSRQYQKEEQTFNEARHEKRNLSEGNLRSQSRKRDDTNKRGRGAPVRPVS